MAVKIRLMRIGAKGQPSYRVVVMDSRKARGGVTIDILGNYNPLVEPSKFDVDKDKVLLWIKKGAKPSFTVRKLLGQAGILKAIDFTNYKKRAPKQKGEAPAEQAPKEAKPEEKKAEAKPAEKK